MRGLRRPAKQAWTGRPAVPATPLALADEHSRSPQESRLRLVWQLDAGTAAAAASTAPLFDLAAGCSATPTCSTRSPASSVSTTARTTGRRSSTAATSTARRGSATTTSRSFRVTGPDLREAGPVDRPDPLGVPPRRARATRSTYLDPHPSALVAGDRDLDQLLDRRDAVYGQLRPVVRD